MTASGVTVLELTDSLATSLTLPWGAGGSMRFGSLVALYRPDVNDLVKCLPDLDLSLM